MDNSGRLISYIFPVYNEAGNIGLLYDTMVETVANLPYAVEMVFVNDGSRDNSLAKLRELQSSDSRVRVIDFARNYGHQIAVTAGLDASLGDAVIIMDSDLQDPPSVSLELVKKWEEGWDVVAATRRTRKDTAFKKASAFLFYKGLRLLSEVDIPANTGDFRLLDRRVVDELKKFGERDRFIRGLVSYIGFKQTTVLFDRDARHHGKTGYPLSKMIAFAADGIMGFSTFPLKFIGRVGFGAAVLSLIGVIYILIVRLFVTTAVLVPGWAFIVLSVLFVGGLQLIMLGIVGSYVGRIYREVQKRPLYAVREPDSRPIINEAPLVSRRPEVADTSAAVDKR